MSDIPSEVFREILLRLPAESLFRFRSVCKTWLYMMDDPSFIKAHAIKQVHSHTLLVRNETGAPIYSFSLDSLNFIKGPQKIEAIRIKQLIRPGVPRLPNLSYSHVASCNGLVLLSHKEDIKKIWALWNPLTGECHELPQPNDSLQVDGFGLGYDYDADDYKVVRLHQRLSAENKVVIHTLVYSMKLGSWSMFEVSLNYVYSLLQNPGALLNGTLYWSSTNGILALDLSSQTYSQFPMPPDVIRSNFQGLGHLDALDGCLIFSCFYNNFCGWVMEENGAWIKLFSISSSFCDDRMGLELVAYLKSKRQVVLQHDYRFLWFDVDNNSVLKFSIHGFPYINSSQICSLSLVRLNARVTTTECECCGAVIGSRKTSTKKRKRMSEKTDSRLKICVRNIGDVCCSDNRFCSEDMCTSCDLGEERRFWESGWWI